MADDPVVTLPLPVGLKLGAKVINDQLVFTSVMVDDEGENAVSALLAALLSPALANGAATDSKLEAVRALLAAPLTAVAIDPSTNIAIPNTPSVFVTPADAQGNMADGPVVTGSGVNVGDVLVDLVSTCAQTIVFDVPSPNASVGLIVQSTLDGQNWNSVPIVNISSHSQSPQYSGVQAKAGRYAAPIAGGVRARIAIGSAGSSAVSVVARTIARDIVNLNEIIDTPFSLTGAIGQRIAVSGRLLTGYELFNASQTVLYAQFCDSQLNPPVAGTPRLLTVPIPIGASLPQYGLRMPVTSGLGVYFSTDYAGAIAASANQVLGTVFYSA